MKQNDRNEEISNTTMATYIFQRKSTRNNKIVNVNLPNNEKINHQSVLPRLNMEEIMKDNPIGFYLTKKEILLILPNEKNPLKLIPRSPSYIRFPVPF